MLLNINPPNLQQTEESFAQPAKKCRLERYKNGALITGFAGDNGKKRDIHPKGAKAHLAFLGERA